jgi:cytochrome b6-f complex iron-sulfur subunit
MTEPLEPRASTPDGVTRRTFLSTAWLAISTLAAGEAAYLGLRYIGSRKATSIFGEVVTAGTVDEFAPGTITLFSEARFFLVRFEDGGLLALHDRCTHLACVVSWDEREHRFRCPCHGSAFKQDGSVINPPAPRALDRFAVSVDEGEIKVDTEHRLRRSNDLHADVVYAPEGAG